MKTLRLRPSEYDVLKKSFDNIYGYFVFNLRDADEFLACIQKWGLQLKLKEEDLPLKHRDNKDVKFYVPTSRLEALEQVFDVVSMIYLDQEVEDIELQLATLFAEAMDFDGHVVGDLLKAIVTAPHDGISRSEARAELELLLHDFDKK